MNYIWSTHSEARKERVHIQKHLPAGEPIWAALCGIKLPFNRSINAPFALGRKICKHCEAVHAGRRAIAA